MADKIQSFTDLVAWKEAKLLNGLIKSIKRKF